MQSKCKFNKSVINTLIKKRFILKSGRITDKEFKEFLNYLRYGKVPDNQDKKLNAKDIELALAV